MHEAVPLADCAVFFPFSGAIAAPDLGQVPTPPQQAPVLASVPSFRQRTLADGSAGGQSTDGHAADVEHMLLVALEGMYKEEREPDVRLGLLRVALHVLQRHGEALSRCGYAAYRACRVLGRHSEDGFIPPGHNRGHVL